MRLLKNKVAKAGIAYTIGNMLIKGIAFISTPIFTRLMTPEEYGVVNNYLAYEAILTIFIGLLTYSSIKSAKYEFENEFEQYISNIIVLNLVVAAIYMMLINIFASVFVSITSLSRVLLNLLVLNCLGTTIIYIYNNYLSLSYSYNKYLKVSAFNALFNITLSLVLMLTIMSKNRANARILGYCVPLIFLSIYITCFFVKKATPTYNKLHYTFAMKYSLPLIPNGVADVILAQFDRIMIQSIVGAWAVGIYSLSYSIYSILAIVRNSLDMVWGPWCFENLKQERFERIKRKSLQYSYLVLTLSVILMLIVPELVFILGSKSYQDAKYTSIPLILASFFVMMNSLPTQVIYYHKKTSWISIGAIGAAIINIGLNYIAIKRIGYVAAAYTTAFSYLLLFYYNSIVVKNILKIDSYNFRILTLLVIIGILASIVSLFLMPYIIIRYVLLGVILVLTCIFGVKYLESKKGEY